MAKWGIIAVASYEPIGRRFSQHNYISDWMLNFLKDSLLMFTL